MQRAPSDNARKTKREDSFVRNTLARLLQHRMSTSRLDASVNRIDQSKTLRRLFVSTYDITLTRTSHLMRWGLSRMGKGKHL